jgi:hypothetical protein
MGIVNGQAVDPTISFVPVSMAAWLFSVRLIGTRRGLARSAMGSRSVSTPSA